MMIGDFNTGFAQVEAEKNRLEEGHAVPIIAGSKVTMHILTPMEK